MSASVEKGFVHKEQNSYPIVFVLKIESEGFDTQNRSKLRGGDTRMKTND